MKKTLKKISKIVFGVIGIFGFLGILNTKGENFSLKIIPFLMSIGLIYASGLLTWFKKKIMLKVEKK